MPQGMHGDVFAETGCFRSLAANPLQLPRRDMPLRIGAREQPVGRAIDLPIGPQEIEQLIGQHHVAVFASFALPHVDDHAGVIDVLDGERDQLGDPQARGVDGRECGSVFDAVKPPAESDRPPPVTELPVADRTAAPGGYGRARP